MIAIAAMSENRTIGNGDKIPWRLKDDFAWFKQKTMGGTLIMGRKTYASIGKPLPGRITIVITNYDAHIAYAPNMTALTWSGFLREPPAPNQFLCGGAQIYELGLPLCDSLFLTRVHDDFDGDIKMPAFEHLFPKMEIVSEHLDETSGLRFTIEHHTK